MSILRPLVLIVTAGVPITGVAQTASEPESGAFRGIHEFEISIGVLSSLNVSSDVSVGSLSTTAETAGLIGSLAYNYWLTGEWAVNLSIGVASADVSTSVGSSGAFVESATIVPLLLGVRYRPLGLAIGNALRPYGYASIGPYFGFASDVRAGVGFGVESYSEIALGSRLGVGMSLSLAKRFTLGAAIGYRLVSDFGRRIGSEKNHSSPEFSFSLGIAVGRVR